MREIQKIEALTEQQERLEERFLRYLDLDSENSIKTYKRALKRFFRWLYEMGVRELESLNREVLLSYREFLKGDGLSSSTISLYMTVAKRFCGWICMETGRYNFAFDVKSGKIDQNYQRQPLEIWQIHAVLGMIDRSCADGRKNYAIITLMLTTGLREAEVAGINIGDYDGRKIYIRGKGRNQKDEYVLVSPQVKDAIESSLKDRERKSPDDPLFKSRSGGGHLAPKTISWICKTAFRRAGIDSPRLTAHSLRHTAAVMAIQEGNSLETVQTLLRHASSSTTRRYSHMAERAMSAPEDDISNLIFQK